MSAASIDPPHAAAPASRPSSWLGLLGLSLVPMFAFARFVSGDRVPIHRDLLVFVIPFKHFLAQSFADGRIPLWNPWIFLGEPFLGSLQSGIFYPPSLFLLLPFPSGFNLLLLFHYELALVGMWLLLRHLGLSLSASVIGGLTFSLGGYMVSLLSLTNHLEGAAWAPWFILSWSRWASKASLRRALVVAIVLALQLLAGSPEHLLMTVVAGASSTWLAGPRRWRSLARHAVTLLAVSAVAAAFAAFQILPTAEYLLRSTRSDSIPVEQVFHWSLMPSSLLGLLFPNVEPAVDSLLRHLYLGLVPLCLAIAGLASRNSWPWSMIVACGFALALGDHFPVLPFLHDFAPAIFGRFRYPEKFYFLVHLGTTMLAAHGAERVLRGEAVARRLASWAAACCVTAAAVVVWLGGARSVATFDFAAASIRVMAILGVFAALLWSWRSSLISRQSACVLLVALVLVDVTSMNVTPETASWTNLSSQPLIVDVAELRATHQRIFHYEAPGAERDANLASIPAGSEGDEEPQAWSALLGDVGMVYGVASVGGAEGFLPRWIESLLAELPRSSREGAIRLLRTYSTGFLIGRDPRDSPSLERVGAEGGSPYFVYRVNDPLPVAYLVSRLRPVASDEAAFAAIRGADLAVGREAVVSELPPDWSDVAAEDDPSKTVSILDYGDDSVRLRSRSTHRAFLVLNDAFFPGWEARIDGVATRIFRANVLVRGIAVGPGEHEIEFTYRPRSLRWGIFVSLSAAVACAAIGVATRKRVPA